MKPLCADCGTEHQPCDHPADQGPENRRVELESGLRELNQLRDCLLRCSHDLAMRRVVKTEMQSSFLKTAVLVVDNIISRQVYTLERTQP